MRRMAVASTWAVEWRMRSSSVIFARSSRVLRSFSIKGLLATDGLGEAGPQTILRRAVAPNWRLHRHRGGAKKVNQALTRRLANRLSFSHPSQNSFARRLICLKNQVYESPCFFVTGWYPDRRPLTCGLVRR